MKKSRISVFALAVVFLFFTAGDTFGATYTIYSSLSNFLTALGGVTPLIQNFDSYTAGQDLSGTQLLPGVTVTSNMQNIVAWSEGTGNDLFAYTSGSGWPPNERWNPLLMTYYDINFSSSYNAVGFNIDAWNPQANGPGLIEVFFSDGTSASIALSKTTGLETDPVFFGIIANTPITKIRWNEPPEVFGFNGWEETALDDIHVASVVAFNPLGQWRYHNFLGNEFCSTWSQPGIPGIYHLETSPGSGYVGVADGDYQIFNCGTIQGMNPAYSSYSCLDKTVTVPPLYPHWTWVIIDDNSLQYVHTYYTNYDYSGTYMARGCGTQTECPTGYVSKPSYSGNCANRPQGSVCVNYDDNYIWLVWDAITGWDSSGGTQTAHGGCADYKHILASNCIQLVGTDSDGDLVPDACDNCPTFYNPDQTISTWYEDADNDGYTSGKTLAACTRPAGYKLASELVSTTIIDNCPTVYNPDQADSNNDGLGDACSGGPRTKYTLDVPPNPMSQIMLTTTFVNDTGQNIVTIRPDCVGNITFTVKDSEGNRVDPIDRIRKAYMIGAPDNLGSDVITIAQGASFTVSCKLTDLFPPEAENLVDGDYKFQGTYSSWIQVPGHNLWMGAIKSNEQTVSVYSNYTFGGFFAPVDNPPVLNTAKAGQAIPVKWQLKDPKGVGIDDPSSFVSLISYKVPCSDFQGVRTDEITVVAPGSSTLQYLGGGNWQYNWKTGKSYATTDGPCRTMVLTLKDGTAHIANFKLK